MRKRIAEYATIISGLYVVYLFGKEFYMNFARMQYLSLPNIVILTIFIVSLGIVLYEKYVDVREYFRNLEDFKNWVIENNLYDQSQYDTLDQKIRVLISKSLSEHENSKHKSQ